MGKKTVAIVVIILLVIAVCVAYLASSSADQQIKQDMMTADRPTSQGDTPVAGRGGSYVDHNSDIIAQTSGTKLLFFHAAWCPQCRMLEADIKEKGVPDGVTIIKVDYDTNQQLRQKYGVTLQTTIVRIDDNGNLVKKYIAYDEPTLEAITKNLL